MRSVLRLAARRYTVAWLALFAAVHAYWDLAEAVHPGQQYADPLLPCVALAMLGAPLALAWPVPTTPNAGEPS